ncbi:sporozoite surface protein 2, partial [Biomphalaria glabrata]
NYPVPNPNGQYAPNPNPQQGNYPVPNPNGQNAPNPNPQPGNYPVPNPNIQYAPNPQPGNYPVPNPNGQNAPNPNPQPGNYPVPKPNGQYSDDSQSSNPVPNPVYQPEEDSEENFYKDFPFPSGNIEYYKNNDNSDLNGVLDMFKYEDEPEYNPSKDTTHYSKPVYKDADASHGNYKCDAGSNRKFPIEGVCFAYFVCVNSELQYRQCKDGFRFNAASASDASCVPDPTCVTACQDGWEADPNDITYYFLNKQRMPCPEGTYFDRKICGCQFKSTLKPYYQ